MLHWLKSQSLKEIAGQQTEVITKEANGEEAVNVP